MNNKIWKIFPIFIVWICLSGNVSDDDSDNNVSMDESTASAGISEGLIGRWTFDVASNTGLDVVSKRFNANMDKKYRIVSGVSGNAIELSPKGKSGAKIEISPDVIPVGLKEFSFSIWIAPKVFEADNCLFRKEDVGMFGENRMLFAFRNNGKYLSLGINCGRNYAECKALISSQERCDGTGHLAVGTFDGHTMRVYLDGREIGSLERQAPLNTVHDFAPLKIWRDEIARSKYETLDQVTLSGVPLFIGSNSGTNDFFNGKIDDVRLYAKAINSNQIALLYEEGKQQTSPIVKKAQETSESIYKKGNSFIKTLDLLDNSLQKTDYATIDDLSSVELQRKLREDYPEETNAYITKWQKNPIDNLLLNDKDRTGLAEKLASAAFEYLPLTPLQWSVLPKNDRNKWERVKEIHSQFDSKTWAWTGKKAPGVILYEMENLVEERPKQSEAVAAYIKPETPPLVSRTTEEAQKVIEDDWLFQCDGKPTIGRTIQEIAWTRKL
ncbi:MAG: LamG domain-containing protein, partial [Tannerella sp.]|nr:LamG domain-containing protein [Tannerella sp.]